MSFATGFDDTTLRRFADLLVGFGANVQPGQIVAIGGETGKEEVMRALAESAYRHGAKFVDAATEVKSKPAARRGRTSASMTSTRPDKEQPRAIREWARANGHQVSSRGRVPAAIREAFSAAHENPAGS